MLQKIDHIVIAVRDLRRASADYERLGFTVTPGGEHASGDTHNALIPFEDGTYFELIAFKEPDRPQSHRWWPLLNKGEGLVDFALLADDLSAEADRLTETPLAVEGPTAMGRLRPDGQRIDWRTITPQTEGTRLPFVIEDTTPRPLRVPGGDAAKHRLGVTGVAGLTVLVSDLGRSAAALAALLGTSGASITPRLDTIDRVQRFTIGEQWIELAQPAASAKALQERLQSRGDGPYEVVLSAPAEAAGQGELLPLPDTHGARMRIIAAIGR